MKDTLARRWFWIIESGVGVLFLCIFGSIIFPFAFSFMFAYGLSPLVEKSLRYVPSRTCIALGMILCLILLGIMGVSFVLPILEQECSKLAVRIPSYISYLGSLHGPTLEKLHTFLSEEQVLQIREGLMLSIGRSAGTLSALLHPLLSSGIALAGMVSTFCLIPIVLFYFLRDWPHIVYSVEHSLPLSILPTFEEIRKRIRKSLSRYLRGQFLIAIILSGYYSVGLFAIGIESAGVLGIITGFLSFVPFIGALTLFLVTLLICAVHYASFGKLIALASLFLCAQFLEMHFLYPRFVEKEARLHPVWVLFSLLAGMQLGGLIGIIFAIPAASILNAILTYAQERFRSSAFYLEKAEESL
ncbi:MAG: AI-2E family transporter [Holosporales bacterium]|jgi:predicted PurR-regulated permease PerM|nr:AI-2E family transporter [Holosporales bacterium]